MENFILTKKCDQVGESQEDFILSKANISRVEYYLANVSLLVTASEQTIYIPFSLTEFHSILNAV